MKSGSAKASARKMACDFWESRCKIKWSDCLPEYDIQPDTLAAGLPLPKLDDSPIGLSQSL